MTFTAQLALPLAPRAVARLQWRTEPDGRRFYPCPGCGGDTSVDVSETTAEVERDPMCCWCRPVDDPRLAERIREKRLTKRAAP